MDNYIGENIKIARVRAGFTQEKLAEKMEVSLSVISRLETGRTMVSVQKFQKLADILHTPIEFFFQRKKNDVSYPISSESATLEHAKLPNVQDPSISDSEAQSRELYQLIENLPDKAKKYFIQSLKCYLDIF